MLERLFAIAGLVTLAAGLSFVRGAVKENEPRAAETGARVFGGVGLGFLALAAFLRLWRKRTHQQT